jgi:hypothetical protein
MPQHLMGDGAISACRCLRTMAVFGAHSHVRIVFADVCVCCRSSGVEHSLGKGEAESSNLSGSTMNLNDKVELLIIFTLALIAF